jgi:hypothetical protein
MSWISVKDKLPINYRNVLFYSEECGIAEGWYNRATKTYQFRLILSDAEPTHWMRLPKPPSEEKK